MIALLAAAAVATLAPQSVLAKYQAALAALHEPRIFTVEYTLEQRGIRTLEQTHRIFRAGNDERDETIAVNGTRASKPAVRIFRGRRYRYTVSSLAPRANAYDFRFVGTHKDGRHLDYVFRLMPKQAAQNFTFTQLTVDGVTFLPSAVSFASRVHDARGDVTFAKAGSWWVANSASASAREPQGTAHERLTFSAWRFPPSLPPATFGVPRALPTQSPPKA